MEKFHSVEYWSAELKRMLHEQRPEDLHLDYKGKMSLLPQGRGGGGIDKQKRAEDISKDVSSFLNSDGGVLVYGVPETEDPNVTGGAPVPGGQDVGFERGEIDKETIEHLVTSNVQPRPGPDLFQVTEIACGDIGRIVFIVEVTIGVGDVWQAADKRYYKRFQFKAEPMEHYEINLARNRNLGPDLRLIFGVNGRWEQRISGHHRIFDLEDEVVQVHIGIRNDSDTVAESALIEIGLSPMSDASIMNRLRGGEFPDELFPPSFARSGIRMAQWKYEQGENRRVNVAFGQLSWNGSNSELSGSYAPIFKTETPLPVAVVTMKGVYHSPRSPQVGYCFWRLQAPSMAPRKGIATVYSIGSTTDPGTPFTSIDVYETDWGLT